MQTLCSNISATPRTRASGELPDDAAADRVARKHDSTLRVARL
jgi:hypothetical protein